MVLLTMSWPIPWNYWPKLKLLHINVNGLINDVSASSVELLAQIKIITLLIYTQMFMVLLTMSWPIPWNYQSKLKLLHTNVNGLINDVSANSVELLAKIKIITHKC